MPAKNDISAIEVRVEEIAQLFDTLDPFPFRERDLDKDAEEYIVGWAREFPRHHPIKIIVHAPESELRNEHANQLGAALSRYFSYRAEITGRDLNELFRVGRLSLIIGLAVCGKTEQRSRSDSHLFTSRFGYVHAQNEFFSRLLAVLTICVLTARAATAQIGDGSFSGIVKESLIILG